MIRDKETQEILGVHMLGHGATESIAAASVVSTLVHESPVSAIPEHQS